MVSYTRQTTTRREIRAKTAGRAAKRARSKAGTPAFPIHPPGYDPAAADARPAVSASQVPASQQAKPAAGK
jgi:hypothetical protein